jgi:alkanesulfonate monooxygenase SsuD/methylene tetrahydromethanopterin reductase-like flavin-dependent oxidoreductase (luciferase family)
LATTGSTWPRRSTTALAVALLVAEHTERITVRTSVALAFTRSPTLTAYAAWDLSKLSGGRFELGLGTQIRQNIEDRYAVPFGDDPVGRLGDYVGAVRAAFASFASGAAPAYESPHYRVTRMQPYFNPGPDTARRKPADLPRGECSARPARWRERWPTAS